MRSRIITGFEVAGRGMNGLTCKELMYIKQNELIPGNNPNKVYDDAGHLAVGPGVRIFKGMEVGGDTVDRWTMEKFNECVRFLDSLHLDLDDNRRQALLDMIWHHGNTKFLGFKIMIQALRMKDYLSAGKEVLWNKTEGGDVMTPYYKKFPVRAKTNALIIHSGKLL